MKTTLNILLAAFDLAICIACPPLWLVRELTVRKSDRLYV